MLVVVYCATILIASTILYIINSLYMAYIIDLDHDFAPSDMTREIHELYSRCIDNTIQTMTAKQSRGFEKTGPGRRMARGGQTI